MKLSRLATVYEWGLLAVLFLIVLHAPLSVGFGQLLPDFADLLKAWKEIVLTVLGILGLILITKRKLWNALLKEWLVRLGIAFIGVHVVLALIIGGDVQVVVAGLMIDLRFVAMLLLMYVLIKIRPGALSRVFKTATAAAVLVLGFGLLQITVLPDDALKALGYSAQTISPFTTIDKNPDFVRINSTLRGPNPLGALAVVYAALVVAYLVRNGTSSSVIRKWAAIGGVISGVAVMYASYSRSAYGAFLAAVIAVAIGARQVSRNLMIAGGATVLVSAIGALFLSSTDWFSNVILHEDPESTVVSKSNDEHIASLVNGAKRVAVQPFGAGIGSTGSASLYDDDSTNDFIIENNYFFIAHESGWLGLIVFLCLYTVALIALWRKRQDWRALGLFASGIGLGLIGLLLPVWVDETVALTWWGLTGAILAVSGIMKDTNEPGTRKQKTTRAT